MMNTIAGQLVLQLGPFASPPGILVTLVIIALVILIGRFLLAVAWRLVLIGIVIVAGLWLLGVLAYVLQIIG